MNDPEVNETSPNQDALPLGDAPGPEEEAMAAEHDALMEQYLSNLQEAKEGEVRLATVVAVGEDGVLVNLGDKSEGIAPLNEFATAAGDVRVKVGDQIDVQIVERDSESGHIIVSHKNARRLGALRRLNEAAEKGAAMSGTVVRAVKSGLMIDCGVECFMPASHIDLRRVENLEEWAGREVEFAVLDLNRQRGRAVVSRRKLLETLRDQRGAEVLASLKEGDVVNGTVRNVLPFGAFVDLGGVEAFIPREEISWEKASAPVDYLRPGNQVEARVIKINPEGRKITLSRKRMTPDPWEGIGQRFKKGDTLTGEVTGLTKFGAFVRIAEGLTGLVHLSDLSWSTVQQRPEDLLKEGDQAQVVILEIDSERQRISLGMKQLTEDPWTEVESRFAPGSRVRGVVTGLAKFGAFVRLADNIEGLIHIGDFTWDDTPPALADVAKVGEEIEAVVLKTNRAARRISLGVKQLTPSPMETFSKQYRTGDAVEGKVTRLTDQGVFLELATGVEAFMHVSQLSTERVDKPSQVCKVGDVLTVKILKASPRDNRIAVSLRAHLVAEERAAIKTYLKDEKAKGGTNLGDLLQNLTLPSAE